MESVVAWTQGGAKAALAHVTTDRTSMEALIQHYQPGAAAQSLKDALEQAQRPGDEKGDTGSGHGPIRPGELGGTSCPPWEPACVLLVTER